MKKSKIDSYRNDQGFINLNKLKSYREKGIVVEGSNAKTWFNVNGIRFLFKEYESVLSCFGEVLYYNAAKSCGVNCAKYDFATCNGRFGTISYDFLEEKEAYYNFLELSCNFGNSNFDLDNISSNKELLIIQNNKYNNMNAINGLVKNVLNASDDEIKTLEMGLVEMFTLDTIFWHLDRTLWNYGIIIDEESDQAKLAPIHDNSYVLHLHKGKEYIEETIINLINFGVVNGDRKHYSNALMFEEDDSIEQLIEFYANCDGSVRNRIDKIVNSLDVENLMKETLANCKLDEVCCLWVKAVLNFRKKAILRGLESVKINDDEARKPSVTFSKRK